MANWQGGSCPAMAGQIAGGFMTLSSANCPRKQVTPTAANIRSRLCAWRKRLMIPSSSKLDSRTNQN